MTVTNYAVSIILILNVYISFGIILYLFHQVRKVSHQLFTDCCQLLRFMRAADNCTRPVPDARFYSEIGKELTLLITFLASSNFHSRSLFYKRMARCY